MSIDSSQQLASGIQGFACLLETVRPSNSTMYFLLLFALIVRNVSRREVGTHPPTSSSSVEDDSILRVVLSSRLWDLLAVPYFYIPFSTYLSHLTKVSAGQMGEMWGTLIPSRGPERKRLVPPYLRKSSTGLGLLVIYDLAPTETKPKVCVGPFATALMWLGFCSKTEVHNVELMIKARTCIISIAEGQLKPAPVRTSCSAALLQPGWRTLGRRIHNFPFVVFKLPPTYFFMEHYFALTF